MKKERKEGRAKNDEKRKYDTTSNDLNFAIVFGDHEVDQQAEVAEYFYSLELQVSVTMIRTGSKKRENVTEGRKEYKVRQSKKTYDRRKRKKMLY